MKICLRITGCMIILALSAMFTAQASTVHQRDKEDTPVFIVTPHEQIADAIHSLVIAERINRRADLRRSGIVLVVGHGDTGRLAMSLADYAQHERSYAYKAQAEILSASIVKNLDNFGLAAYNDYNFRPAIIYDRPVNDPKPDNILAQLIRSQSLGIRNLAPNYRV
jgi:hypothetical protein